MNRIDEQFKDLLKMAESEKASDLHLLAGQVPILRIHGKLTPLGKWSTPIEIRKICEAMLTQEQINMLKEKGDIDIAYTFLNQKNSVSRCRINIFREYHGESMAIRFFADRIPDMDELKLPISLKELTEYNHGLVLVTGPTGSGKSTTIAAMLNHINQNRCVNVITIEEPIEYLHPVINSIIRQREVGKDVQSFATGLRATLRQDPNVIFIGEMRDRETIETALHAAETGHLVFSTLHAGNTIEAIDRLLQYFPAEQQNQINNQIANSIIGIVAQQLLVSKQGGLVAALEILLATPAVLNLIRTGQIYQIKNYMQPNEGMQTMEDAIKRLENKNII